MYTFEDYIEKFEVPRAKFEDMYRYPELARQLMSHFIINRYNFGESIKNNMLQMRDIDISIYGIPNTSFPIAISEKFKGKYYDKLYLEIRTGEKRGYMLESLAGLINFSYNERSELYSAQKLKELTESFIDMNSYILTTSIEDLKKRAIRRQTCAGQDQWYIGNNFFVYKGQIIENISLVITDNINRKGERWSNIEIVISKETLKKLGISPKFIIETVRPLEYNQ